MSIETACLSAACIFYICVILLYRPEPDPDILNPRFSAMLTFVHKYYIPICLTCCGDDVNPLLWFELNGVEKE